MEEDLYFKKLLAYKSRGKTLLFRVSQDLFSSYQVDVGTRFLLRAVIDSDSPSFGKVLDLGCGYGPLGLTTKSVDGAAVVHMVDRDALAVEYARQNAVLNEMSGIEVYGSLGYDDVHDTDFDLILANIPGKAGEEVITHFIRDAVYYLKPGGLVAVVVVRAIETMLRNILESSPDIEIVFHQVRSGHAVFHYRFTGTVKNTSYVKAFDRGVYERNDVEFGFRDLKYRMQTARGLPEFDSLHYRTGLMLEALQDIGITTVKRAVVLNPGQGHVPVALWKLGCPDSIVLVDRDLLGLRYSEKNLIQNGCPADNVTVWHRVGMETPEGEPADIISIMLREEEGPRAVVATVDQAANRLEPGGIMLVSGSSTVITRLISNLQPEKHLEISGRIKKKGYSLLRLKSG
jgi:16S rRNA (guanine1207-N2)-methyltransferase